MKKTAILVFLTLCLAAFQLSAQNISVKGKITDAASGETVPFATIVVKGTNSWTTTDADGNYSLQAPANGVLSVAILGYAAVEEPINSRSVVDFALKPEFDELTESVAIGYGTQKKKLITGSTINVSGDLIKLQNTTDATGALYSSVPGVNITAANGQPWSGYKITVRGLGTTGNGNPLIVVDGVAGGDLSSIAPSDIESIDILKDAASSAIYGARAANGVVLVTTRQAKKSDKIHINFDASWGFQNPNFNGVHAVDAKQYMDLVNEARTQKEADPYDYSARIPVQYKQIMDGTFKGTDWLKESVNKNAPQRSYSVGFNGGNDIARYSFSYTNSYVEGTLGAPKKTYYNRNALRLNSEFSLWRKNNRDIVKFGENAIISIYDSNSVSQGDMYGNIIRNLMKWDPLLPAFDSDGTFYTYEDQQRDGFRSTIDGLYNVLEDNAKSLDEGRTFRVQANAYIEVLPHKDWKFRSVYGQQFYAKFSRSYTPAYQFSNTQFETTDKVSQSASLSTNRSWENTLSWKHAFGDHNVDALIGTSIESSTWGESIKGSRKMTKFGTWESANLEACESDINAENVTISGSNNVPYNKLLSFFFRANYNYKDTYLFTFTAREDGSSNFARGHRWGFFPSASAGWIMTNEKWMHGVTDVMNYFKIRASWGQNGNCMIDNFQYAATVSLGALYDFTKEGQSGSTGAYPDILPNAALSWETSEQTDLGFDARFFNSKLGVTFDYYRKDTKDWLVDAPVLATYGTGAPTINGGAVRNEGVELSLNWADKVGDFFYNIGINGSYNKNKVLYINNSEGIIRGEVNVLAQGLDAYPAYEARTGFPIGHFIGIKSEGIFQNQAQIDEYNAKGYAFMDGYEKAQPGDVIWIDQNGDGAYDENDVVEIGNPFPDFNMGLNINLEWKGFDLNISGSGAFGQQVMNSYRSFVNNDDENYTNIQVARYWTGEGSTNSFPRYTSGSHNNLKCNKYLGDVWVFDADYFKIRNITLGYDLKKAIKNLPIPSLRLYVSGTNLFCITKYDGMDPEVGYSHKVDWTSGIDIGSYPSPRAFIFGVNVKF